MLEALAAKFAGSLGSGLGEAIGGGSGPFMGGSAEAAAYGTTLDGSGWVVNMGGTQLASASPTRSTIDPVAATQSTSQAGMSPWLIGAVVLAAFIAIKRKGRA